MTHNYIPNRGTNGVFFAPLHNIRWPVRDGDQKLKKNEERSYTHEWRLDIPNGLVLECFSRFNRPYIINWICENLPTENCSHLTRIRSECDVFGSDKTENHTTTGNEKEKQRKQGEWKEEKRKSNGCTLSLHCGYFGTSILVQSFSQEFLGKASYSSALYQFCQKTVSVIEVWCCKIGYLLRCGKRELSPPLNPVAANPF